AIASGIALSASAAFAYWTTSGSGAGSATVASNNPAAGLVVTQFGAVTNLIPGDTASSFSVKVHNSNPGTISAGAVTASVHAFSSPAEANSTPACTQNDFTVVSSPDLVGSLASGGETTISGFSIRLNNGLLNQDNCKGL